MANQTVEPQVWKILRALNEADKFLDDLAVRLDLNAEDTTTILDALKVRFAEWP